jgi:hypothetical protein
MDRLRHAHLLARAVLAWFVFTLAASVAAPVFKAPSLESICTGTGGMVLVEHGGSPAKTGGHQLECPLCVSFSAPPALPPAFHLPAAAQVLGGPAPAWPQPFAIATSKWPRGPPHHS